MKILKKYIAVIVAVIVLFTASKTGFSQNYTMTNGGSISACTGTFLDPGGLGNYTGTNSTWTYTICNPTPGQPLFMNFTSMNLWNGACGIFTYIDQLTIYDGATIGAPVLFEVFGTSNVNPGAIVGTTGCLTFRFVRQGTPGPACSTNPGAPGWSASISCTAPPLNGDNCIGALPFCTGSTTNFPNNYNDPVANTPYPYGPNYGCLFLHNNASWYFMQIGLSGTLQFNVSQTTGPGGTGAPLSMVYALYGPFSSVNTICNSVMYGTAPIQCSYSLTSSQTIGLGLPGGSGAGASTPPAAIAGQFYLVMLCNPSYTNGYFNFTQTGGAGAINCAPVTPCNMTSLTATPSACNGVLGNYGVSGQVNFTLPPATGTLTVTSSCGASQVFNAPFASPINYSLTGLTANGAACSVTAVFSGDVTCALTQNYTAPTATVSVFGGNQTHCYGSIIPPLPTTSTNGITGSWFPAISNTANQTYTFTPDIGQCATTATLDITILPYPIIGNNSTQICSGSTFNFQAYHLPPANVVPPGTQYTWTVLNNPNITGESDQLVPQTSISQTLTNTSTVIQHVFYTITPQSANSALCASSTFTLDVTVYPSTIPFFTTIPSLCLGSIPPVLPSVSLNGLNGSWTPATINTSILGPTTYNFYTPDEASCLVTSVDIVVNVEGIVNSTTIVSNCINYTWTNGTTYTNSGIFTQNLTNTAGCDSVATLNLTITQPTTSTTTIVNCTSYTWTNGTTYTNSGTFTQTLTNVAGCDSIATLDLTITQPTTSTITIVNCTNYTWTNGTTYTNSGTFTQTLTNAAGCDSIATLDLTITQPTTSTITIVNCTNYTWTNGTTYTNSGTFTQTLTNAAGCDSVATLNLTITQPTTSTTTIVNCTNYIWTNGTTYTNSGTFTQTLTNAAGCDSVATLNLTITQPTTSTTTIVNCTSFTWTNGTTYTNSGTFTQTLTNAAGCDSVATLNLTITQPTTSTTTIVNCTSFTWTNGTTYTNSGTFTQTLTNTAGCDSVVTLNLTITQPTTSTTTIVNCINYTWTNGTTYTNSGTFAQTLTNAAGCDSVATLNLTITQPTTSTTTIVNCASYTWTNGTTYTNSGTFTQTLTNAAGCDSVATLNLAIMQEPVADFNSSSYEVSSLEPQIEFENTSHNNTTNSWFLNGDLISSSVDLVYNFNQMDPGSYIFQLIVTNGSCIDSISKLINVTDDLMILVPNAFTSNGDEHNSIFLPILSGGFDKNSYSFTVFNLWGEIVFISQDSAIGWDGTIGNLPVEQGSYIWKIEVKRKNTDLKVRKEGHVILLR